MLKNKIIKLLVGTNNKGKLREIKDYCPKTLKYILQKTLKRKARQKMAKHLRKTH